jgi:cell division protein FtsA
VKFGSSLASENRDDEVVSIPGIRGRAPKEISFRNLASIIQARVEEIFEHVHYEIKNSGFERRLIAGIVLTGGGAMMKHIDQLAAFVTGMDVRIGYPNEHLAKGTIEELTSPMYATGIGLVIEGISRHLNEEEMEKLKASFDPSQPKSKQKQTLDKKGSNYLDKIKKLFDRDLIE